MVATPPTRAILWYAIYKQKTKRYIQTPYIAEWYASLSQEQTMIEYNIGPQSCVHHSYIIHTTRDHIVTLTGPNIDILFLAFQLKYALVGGQYRRWWRRLASVCYILKRDPPTFCWAKDHCAFREYIMYHLQCYNITVSSRFRIPHRKYFKFSDSTHANP